MASKPQCWNCLLCTFSNHPDIIYCELCNTKKHHQYEHRDDANGHYLHLANNSQRSQTSSHNSNSHHSVHSCNTLPQLYQLWFQQHSECKYISEMECIHAHLSTMRQLHHQNNTFKTCVSKISRLMQNIKQYPSEEKYRRIRACNKIFTTYILPVKGYKILMELCGWKYIEIDGNHIDSYYVFDSSSTPQKIQIVSEFLTFYIQQEHIHHIDNNSKHEPQNIVRNQRIVSEPQTATTIPRKHRTSTVRTKTSKTKPNITKSTTNKTSNEEIRAKRMQKFGNYRDVNFGITLVNDNKKIDYNPHKRVTHNKSNNKLPINSIINALNTNQNIHDIITHIKSELNRNENRLEIVKNEQLLHANRVYCKLLTCGSFQNICQVLHSYNMSRLDASFLRIYGDNYRDVLLLNDFYHLLNDHAHEFEDVYNHLNKTLYDNHGCNYNCDMRQRHYRNRLRVKDRQRDNIRVHYGNCCNETIVSIQLLDRIHCFFMHTFDIGYKLTKRQQLIDIDITDDENSYTDENVIRIRRILSTKHEEHRLWIGKQECNKFVSICADINDDEQKSETLQFDFGHRFYYHAKYENCTKGSDPAAMLGVTARQNKPDTNVGKKVCEWYIKHKYPTLKDELLYNTIAAMDKNQFDIMMITTAIHTQSDAIKKQFICTRGESAAYYEMKTGDMITQNQVMAVMIYCNLDDLQYKFSSTFRKSSPLETDKELKERHRNFYWMARAIRECVACIGMKLNRVDLGFDDNMELYHGVNTLKTFGSITAYIKGPFSTTKEQQVAVSFQDSSGLLIELNVQEAGCILKLNEGKHAIKTIMGFDCTMFSKYTNESEVLFIGGLHPIKIVDIIEVNGSRYKLYIEAIRLVTHHMSSGGLSLEVFSVKQDNKSKKTARIIRNIASKLMSNEIYRYYPNNESAEPFTTCRIDYLKEIFHLQCLHVKGMVFYTFPPYDNKLLDRYFRDNNGWIKLNVVLRVFANVEFIGFGTVKMLKGGFEEFERLNVFRSLLSVIKYRQKLHLHLPINIGILALAKHKAKLMREIQQYAAEFGRLEWQIKFRNEDKDDTIDKVLNRTGVNQVNMAQHNKLWKQLEAFRILLGVNAKDLLVIEIKQKKLK